ncbi:aminotransferase class I/II-fold pyridoxal phosphate-dependent enzyme, partial [uncultured Anaerotruncus sp.]|uniref:aminotransferase class I/II-fold pyridoxal phosphate-dependent enzyme n=1 Tax=uncultured Anaerotruncus sp. TaxID=905011 RepID=UPI00258E1EEB
MDYDKILSRRAVALKPSGIRRFFDIAAEMDDVISLGVGEPDFKTPWSIRRAGIESLERGHTWYTANSGLAPLKKEIANYLRRRFTLEYDAKTEVLVTVGGSEAIDLAIRTLVNPGDEVLVVEPSFVCYTPITALTDGVPVPIATKPEDGFRLTPEALRAAITPKTKLLVLPFPNNPTGGIMRREHLEAVAEVLRGTDIMVLSDEIYAELTYGGERHVSFAEIDGMKERTVIVNGFSKSYAMTGWGLRLPGGPGPRR